MNLPPPPGQYDTIDQAALRDAVAGADGQNLKRGSDIELGNGRLIMREKVTGARFALEIVAGVLGITAL